ncbi:MAG: AEC family transporter [Mogibacterium sp.]|nr:AEC family transporter [Mogibacterium sp.]
MLQNFLVCAGAVVPSAIYLIIGAILRASKVLGDRSVKKFTHVIFVALYPFLMFDNLYGKNLEEHMNAGLIIYAVAFTMFQLIASWFFVCRIEPDNYHRGAMIQALFRSNYVLMGLPIAINLFGKGNVTPIAVILLFVVPIYNSAAVIVFEYFRGGHVNIKDMLLHILTNPIIEGGLVALVFIILNIKLPDILQTTVTSLSDCTSPIALILLGAGLNIKSFKSDRARIFICTAGKLIIFPAIGIAGAVLFGFRDVELVAITLMLATPVALASYAMASSMQGNGRLAGELVVISTALSCFTMPIWLFILKTAGLF